MLLILYEKEFGQIPIVKRNMCSDENFENMFKFAIYLKKKNSAVLKLALLNFGIMFEVLSFCLLVTILCVHIYIYYADTKIQTNVFYFIILL